MRRWTASLAVVGAMALVVLVRLVDATAQVPRWSSQDAERHLQATAKAFGVDASKLSTRATTEFNPDAAYAPLRYVLKNKRGSYFRADYAPSGELLNWECGKCGDLVKTRTTPEAVLRSIAGARAPQFTLGEHDESKGSWHWRLGDLEARALLENGAVKEASITSTRTATRQSSLPGSRQVASVFRAANATLSSIALTIAGFLIVFRMLRRREFRRLGIAIAGFWIALLLLTLLLEGRVDSGSVAFYLVGRPLLWLLPCAAGLILIRGERIHSWLGFLHAALRWQPARSTGDELFQGLLLAWPLALIPYLAGFLRGPVWQVLSPDIAFQNVPALDSLLRRTPVGGNEVLYFALIVPLLAKWMVNRKWRMRLLIPIGLLLFGGMAHIATADPTLDIVVGLLLFAASAAIYRAHGLLGLFAASLGSAMVTPLAWLITTPLNHAIPLAASVGVYGGALVGAAWLRRQGVPGEGEELASEIARRNGGARDSAAKSERERLLAELAEAREAQMGMLPASMPTIEGYELAAVCQPAREVGGDLYDLLDFPDGRWGLCVADVSGKGVQAALYMTMTKGLLASEKRVTTDLNRLALALNERLHEAGRKKTFVTMALARLDPRTRCVELIRAGHNPVLWRRASRNETVWLKPGGLGLGLVSNKTFAKKLESEMIEMEPGDLLMLYSDGLTEAENPRLELFGEERLQSIAERADGLNAEALLQDVLSEVERFKEGAEPHDDLTLLVMKVL